MPNIPVIKIGSTTYKFKDSDLRNDIVIAKSTQPTEECNKIWIDESASEEYEIPTLEDINGMTQVMTQGESAFSSSVSNTSLIDTKWISGKTINSTTGELISVSGWSASEEKIRIPNGAVTKIHCSTTAVRVAVFDKNDVFISAVDLNKMDYTIPEGTAGYFRIAYNSTVISQNDRRFLCRFEYPGGRFSHIQETDKKVTAAPVNMPNIRFKSLLEYYQGEYVSYLNDVYRFNANHPAGNFNAEEVTRVPADEAIETVHEKGNPIVFTGGSDKPFVHIRARGQSSGKNITVCGKNIFRFNHPEKYAYVANNVRYDFDHTSGTIRVSSSGATGNTPSASSTFPEESQSVNGVTGIYNNFKFKFKEDTTVSVHGHCSNPQYCDYHCQMRVTDGTTWYPVESSGLIFKAVGGTEYALQVLTRTGWSGDITFRPQIEINSHPTSYEPFNGITTLNPTATGSSNLFTIDHDAIPGSFTSTNNSLLAIFDSDNDEIYIKGTANETYNTTISNPHYSDGVNGATQNYIFKFRLTQDSVVCSRSISKDLSNKLYAYITDGTTRWEDHGDGLLFKGYANTEYAYVICAYAGVTVDALIRPVIATDISAIMLYGSKCGVTTVYTDDNSYFWIVAEKETRENITDNSAPVLKGLNELTSGKISTPLVSFKSRKPMLTIIDDDTKNVSLVQRFHNICANRGVVGNFAVETYNVDANTGLEDLLLQYEQEGFGCVYHCYYQYGSATNYWKSYDPSYDEDLIKENFMTGLRRIKEYGLSNYKYWVTPYGVNDAFIISLAKTHGMECIFNCPTTNFVTTGYVSLGNNVNRWNIPRLSYEESSSDDRFHSIIDACAEDHGWLTIVTHVNTWANNSTMDSRLGSLIQYCKNAGYDIVSVPEAYETFKPILYMNELF